MEEELQMRPSELAMLALCQGVACAVSGPFWGNLVDSGASRKLLLKVGALLWGLCTLQLSLMSNYSLMMLLRALNGAALAMMVPVMQSIVAELSTSSSSGQVFGKVSCAASVGQVMTCLMVTPLSDLRLHGISGWRISLAVVGALSVLLSAFVDVAVHEEPSTWNPKRFGVLRELHKLFRFMKIPTFRVIILQGVFGTIPGAAQSFLTMYLQYVGIENSTCGLILALRTLGEAIGSALGGFLSDLAHVRHPSSGRIVIAMISVLLGIPFTASLFTASFRSNSESNAALYAGLLFSSGVLTSWEVVGCLQPMMIEIVPRRQLASAFAWNVAVVFTSGNTIGPLLVGGTAEKLFHYKITEGPIDDMSDAARAHNADALGKSLMVASLIPCFMSAAVFSMLFCTYPKDRKTLQDSTSDSDDAEDVAQKQAATESTNLLHRAARASSSKA